MRKLLFAFAAGLALLSPLAIPMAHAEDVKWPATPKEAKGFKDNMPGVAWTNIVAASVNMKFFVGKPIVAVLNPMDEELVSVVCDGKWALVGENAYNKKEGAPPSVGPHQVVFIPTNGFDGYCKSSIVGLTESGQRVDGLLNVPGDFTNSTYIYFRAPK